MKKGEHRARILLSFVGTNDAGKLNGKPDGAILTVFRKLRFDEVHLLWNPSSNKEMKFEEIAEYVRSEIEERGHAKRVSLHRFDCRDVTDHNEIYPKLLAVCNSLKPSPSRKFTAAIASGTPAMQSCWILLAESGDFQLELIRSNEPKFGRPLVRVVKLGTGLPRIIRLQEENELLKRENEALIPELELHRSDGSIWIGGIRVPFGPIESVYYRYFAERVCGGESLERFSGHSVPNRFLRQILDYHLESFPEAESSRFDLDRMVRRNDTLAMETFRGNVSKANKKIRQAVPNVSWVKIFIIAAEGSRNARSYGIQAPSDKISIT